MATTSNSSREERRRRIVERGSDRLTLIAGGRSVTSSPLSSPHFRASLRTFASLDHQNPRTNHSYQTNAGVEGSSGACGTTMLQDEVILNAFKIKTSDIGKEVEPEQNIHDTSNQTIEAPAVDDKTKSGSSLVTSTVEKSSNDTQPLPRPSRNQLNLFSCKQDQKHTEDAEKGSAESQEDEDNFTQALKVMERGLVLYQTIRAFFIDFSIYTVVVVSGHSLV